jgi:hypothetical protein
VLNIVVVMGDIIASVYAGSVALHWSLLDGTCCSVKSDEARE